MDKRHNDYNLCAYAKSGHFIYLFAGKNEWMHHFTFADSILGDDDGDDDNNDEDDVPLVNWFCVKHTKWMQERRDISFHSHYAW